MVNPSIVFHRSSRGKGFFTLEEMARRGLDSSAFSHVKHYATSGFDGIRAVWDNQDEALYLILLDEHINRILKTMDYLLMTKSAVQRAQESVWGNERIWPQQTLAEEFQVFGIERPNLSQFTFLDLTARDLRESILETVRANVRAGFIDPRNGCYIRPNFYRAEHPEHAIGVFSLKHEMVLEILAFEWGAYLPRPPNVIVYPEGVVSPIRSHKAGANYGFAGMAKNWAVLQGFDEVLLTDTSPDRNVLEGGGENVYRVSNECRVRTPSLDQSILPGTKRDLVLRLLRNLGVEVTEGKVPLWHFMEANAALFTGTAAGVVGISLVHDPVTVKTQLYNLQNEAVVVAQREYHGLLTGGQVDERNEPLRDEIRTRIKL